MRSFIRQGVVHGTYRLPTSTDLASGPPTVIPFVTPASPFVPPHHPLRLPQAPPLSTTNSSSTTRASPFSSPPPPSTSVSPISHQGHAQDLAAALQQQQQQAQATQLDPSRPSVPSSPHPSLPSGLSHPHPGRSPPLQANSNSNPSHTLPYYLYQHHPGPITDADPQQLLAPAPPPPHTTTHQGLPAPALSFQDLEQYQAWARLGGPSYPFALPSDMDVSAAASSPYADSAAAMEAARMHQQEAQTSRRLPADTTLHFPSTLPPQAGQPPAPRRTPPNPQQQQAQGAHTLPGRPTHANDLTLDQTTMTSAHANGLANGSAAEMLGPLPAGAASTSTGASLGPSLDGSPSWNSAMTHLEMQQQLDHLYRYQAHQVSQVAVGMAAPARSRGPPHPPDSSQPQRSSHSSIGPVGVPLRQQQQQQHAQQAQMYSLELHRQQQEQLRQLRQQQQREETAERERRNSEEEYLRRLAEAYASANGGQLSGSPHPQVHMGAAAYFQHHPHHQQQGHPPPPVTVPSQAVVPDSRSFHAHTGAHHLHHQQALLAHHSHAHTHTMLDGAYPLVDAAPGDPLDMGMAAVLGESPTGMIKYESPLPLE